MLDFAEGDFSIGCSYFSVVCMIIVLLCKLMFSNLYLIFNKGGLWWTVLHAKRKCKQMDETVQERRLRRTMEERSGRRRRRRLHSLSNVGTKTKPKLILQFSQSQLVLCRSQSLLAVLLECSIMTWWTRQKLKTKSNSNSHFRIIPNDILNNDVKLLPLLI